MKFSLLLLIATYIFTFVSSVKPPNQVLVIESSICGNCKNFNYRDVKNTVSRINFNQVVNMTLLPVVHLKESMFPNGTFNYTHSFGDEYLRKAKSQFCVNNLYNNSRALNWAAYYVYQTQNLTTSIRLFFSEDNGFNMLRCVNGPQGNAFTRLAMIIFRQNWYGGMLPQVIIDTKLTPMNRDVLFMDFVCRNRTDRYELTACNGTRSNEEEYGLGTEYNLVFPETIILPASASENSISFLDTQGGCLKQISHEYKENFGEKGI